MVIGSFVELNGLGNFEEFFFDWFVRKELVCYCLLKSFYEYVCSIWKIVNFKGF